MARPHALTPEVRERFLLAVRAGAGNEVAAEYAGISLRTYFRWKADERPAFRQFWQEVEHERVTLKVVVVGNLVALSRRHYRAGIAWLAAQYPSEWGPVAGSRRRRVPQAVTVARQPASPANFTTVSATPEFLAFLKERGIRLPEATHVGYARR